MHGDDQGELGAHLVYNTGGEDAPAHERCVDGGHADEPKTTLVVDAALEVSEGEERGEAEHETEAENHQVLQVGLGETRDVFLLFRFGSVGDAGGGEILLGGDEHRREILEALPDLFQALSQQGLASTGSLHQSRILGLGMATFYLLDEDLRHFRPRVLKLELFLSIISIVMITDVIAINLDGYNLSEERGSARCTTDRVVVRRVIATVSARGDVAIVIGTVVDLLVTDCLVG